MASSSKRPSSDSQNKIPAKKSHWSLGLLNAMNDPELLVESDSKVVIIKDKYPKARHHFLVLPHEHVPNLKSLKPQHAELLKYMEEKAKNLVLKYPQTEFRYGYHAIPSMSQIHLHVISQDFDSPCLKTKKHWNSFNSKYFLDSAGTRYIVDCKAPKRRFLFSSDKDEGSRKNCGFNFGTSLQYCTASDAPGERLDVIRCLEDRGTVVTMSPMSGEKLLEQPLKCHRCVYSPQNMPKFKQHLLKHVNNSNK